MRRCANVRGLGIVVSLLVSLGVGVGAYGQSPSLPSPSSSSAGPGGEGGVPIVPRATLQVGSEGADVLELQATLKLLGFYGGEVSGRYDEATAAAVTQFQQAAGLPAEGVMRPESWTRLFPSLLTLSPPLAAPGDPQVAPVPASAANPPSSQAPTSAGGGESAPIIPPATPPGGRGGEAAAVPASSATATATATTTNSPTTNSPTTAHPSTGPTEATSSTSAVVAATTAPSAAIDLPILRQGMHGPAVVRLQERLRVIGVFDGVVDGIFGAETLAAVKAAQTKFQVDPDGVVGPVTWAALLR
ncbi:peptidoglycan-binding protein [Trichothermofontia sichuanensis B231]|uniref:peptidoglycan-binding domain-containing protein n=1 Tax=Trichothermofontia sichuanensis TaxID=3045816 RepID=UPI0022475680|nr:peptidoglycan-binding domain-containing protein [Trichothermofontia sichuanensis]UZQ55133.1 peptidoglycan-binding protein [Trichothermofontia sichuanensis B231]